MRSKTQSFVRRLSQGGTLAAGMALLLATGCQLAEGADDEAPIGEVDEASDAEGLNNLPPTTGVGDGDLVAMCQITVDPDTGEVMFEDILVEQSAVAGHLAAGDLLGTCASFFCTIS